MVIDYGKIVFGGIDSSDYGIYVSGEGTYNAPERAVEFVNVPGRDGAIAIDQGRFENITVTYPAMYIGKDQEDFREAVSSFRNAILSQKGYQRLEDSYHPDEYRMGIYTAGMEVSDLFTMMQGGTFDLQFNCKPQRWLTCGDYPVPVVSGQFVDNPTFFESSPTLLIQGYGMINFNGYTIGLEGGEMGEINLTPVSEKYISNELIGSHSFVMSIGSAKFLSGDSIYIPWSQTLFGTDMSFYTDGETVSNVTIGTLTNLSLAQLSYYQRSGNDTCKVWLFTRLEETEEFTYGTSATKSYSAAFSFDVGSTTYNYTFSMTMAYDGDDDITVTISCAKTSGTDVDIYDMDYVLNVYKWYGESTFPTWQQGFDYVVIDCDIGEAYAIDGDDIISLNQWVNFGSDLPTLKTGQNKITFDNTVLDLKIKPRWWRI